MVVALVAAALLAAPAGPGRGASDGVRGPRLISDLRLAPAPGMMGAAPSPRLSLAGGGGGLGYLDPQRSSGLDGGVACVASAIVPGLGHAILGAYLPRGLAFTMAFFSTLVGSITAITHAQDSPLLRGQLLFAGLSLALAAEVVYIWAVIDTLTLAARPRHRRPVGRERVLGADG